MDINNSRQHSILYGTKYIHMCTTELYLITFVAHCTLLIHGEIFLFAPRTENHCMNNLVVANNYTPHAYTHFRGGNH